MHLLASLGKMHPGLQVVGVQSEHALVRGRAEPDVPHADLAQPQEVPGLHTSKRGSRFQARLWEDLGYPGTT